MYNVLRHFSKMAKTLPRNHYDSLGITSKATQAEIKSAYYKLSKVYHPDMNEGSDEAAKQFRDITGAYEVLGNVRMRKMYDKGMSFGSAINTTSTSASDRSKSHEGDVRAHYYRSREFRTRPPSGGFSPIYDFDEWSRAHYGTMFAHDKAIRDKRRAQEQRRQKQTEVAQLERLIFLIAFVVLAYMFFFQERNYDVVHYETSTDEDEHKDDAPSIKK